MWWKAASAACSPAPGSWVWCAASQRAMVSKSCSSQSRPSSVIIRVSSASTQSRAGSCPRQSAWLSKLSTGMCPRQVASQSGCCRATGERGSALPQPHHTPKPIPRLPRLPGQRRQPGGEPVVRVPVPDRTLPALVDHEHLGPDRGGGVHHGQDALGGGVLLNPPGVGHQTGEPGRAGQGGEVGSGDHLGGDHPTQGRAAGVQVAWPHPEPAGRSRAGPRPAPGRTCRQAAAW